MRGPKGERIRLPAGRNQLKAAWEGGHGAIAGSRKQRSVSSCARGTEHRLWGGSDLDSSQTPVTFPLGDLEWGHWICLSLDSCIWKSGVVACARSAGDVTLRGIRAVSWQPSSQGSLRHAGSTHEMFPASLPSFSSGVVHK